MLNRLACGSGTGSIALRGWLAACLLGAGIMYGAPVAHAHSAGPLATAVLPVSRSTQVGATVTVFLTMINAGDEVAEACSVALGPGVNAVLSYQTTDATNALTGTADTPVDIGAGAAQSFVIALTPQAAFAPTDVTFVFDCANTDPAPNVVGLNTLLLSSSVDPTADIVALAATPSNDGVVSLAGATGSDAFAVATVNVGAAASITATASASGAGNTVNLLVCETDPLTAACLAPPAASVTTTIGAGATPTFAAFVFGTSAVNFDPANNRVFFTFTDAGGAVRGSTSVAVRSVAGAVPVATATGASIKGIIVGGAITVQEVLPDGSLSGVLGTATTDANGDYSADISDLYSGGPLKVTLTAGAGTTMICDAPGGCGAAEFGDPVALEPGFTLCAYIGELDGDTVDVHVTAITDLAARLADNDPGGLNAAGIAGANDVVRQTFALPGDITAIRPVDLTDPEAVGDADPASQKVAVLSAAILEAVQQTDAVVSGGAGLEDAFNTFAEAYGTQGGLVLNDTPAMEGVIVGLDDILASADDVLDQVETDALLLGVDANLDGVRVDVDLSTMQLPPTTSDDPDTSIDPVDTVTADALTQAKSLVADLRNITASAQLDVFDDAADTFGDTLEVAFEEQVDLVTGLVTNDLAPVIEALGHAVDAMNEARLAHAQNPSLTSFDASTGGFFITVSITDVADGLSLMVDQAIDGVDVNVTGVTDYVETEEVDGLTTTSTFTGAVVLSGTAQTAEFSVEVREGSEGTVDATVVEAETGVGIPVTFSLDAPTIDLDLLVTITALQAADTPKFDGELRIGASDLVITEGETDEQDSGVTTITSFETLTFDTFSFGLSGTFSDATGRTAGASISFSAENTAGFVLRLEEIFVFDPVVGSTESETQNEETAANFVDADLVIGLLVVLPGIDNAADLNISLERTGVEDGAATITLVFSGKELIITANSVDEVISISNQDGVVATVFENNLEQIEGSITVNGEQLATIEEARDDIILVRYLDGTFESLAF